LSCHGKLTAIVHWALLPQSLIEVQRENLKITTINQKPSSSKHWRIAELQKFLFEREVYSNNTGCQRN